MNRVDARLANAKTAILQSPDSRRLGGGRNPRVSRSIRQTGPAAVFLATPEDLVMKK